MAKKWRDLVNETMTPGQQAEMRESTADASDVCEPESVQRSASQRAADPSVDPE